MALNKLNIFMYGKNGKKIRFACVYVPGKTIKHLACKSHLMGFKRAVPIFEYAEYTIYEKDGDSPCDSGVVDYMGNPYYGNIQPEIEILDPIIQENDNNI